MSFSTKGQGALGEADLKALALERSIYATTSPFEQSGLLMEKYHLRKEQGLYAEALSELMRIHAYTLGEQIGNYYYEKALCHYLLGDFTQALATTKEAAFYIAPTDTTTLTQLHLIEALAAAQCGQWQRSAEAARGFIEGDSTLSESQRQESLAQIEKLYSSTPKLRNPMVAWWLSMIPGVGQFYAGEWLRGAVSLVVNGALVGFTAAEWMAGEWLSGWIVGCGGLSTTYFVGQERARHLVEQRNQRVINQYNEKIKDILLAD